MLDMLGSRGNNILVYIVLSEVGIVKNVKGRILIDYNSTIFKHILEYLKTGNTLVLKLRLKPALDKELCYFVIHSLSDKVNNTLLNKLRKANYLVKCNAFLEKYESAIKEILRVIIEYVY
jgi:hypothetical protein